jgi:hypothetical protein
MTNNLGVSTYSIGGDYDTWGAKFVADMAIFNKLAGDSLAIPDVSGTVVLDVTACQNFGFLFNGAGGATVAATVPDGISRFWFVRNSRPTGTATVACAAGLGTSVSLAAGERKLVYSDGTNVTDLTLATIAIAGVSGLQAALDAKQAIIAIATAAQIWANTADKVLDTDAAWASAVPVDLGNVTGSVTLDLGAFINAKAAFTGNVTFNAVTASSAKKGQAGVIEVTHSGAARTLTLTAAAYSAPNGAGITLSTVGAGTKDLLGYYVMDNGKVLITPMALAVA